MNNAVFHRAAVELHHLHAARMDHLPQIAAQILEQQERPNAFDSAAGAACAGAEHHQHQQYSLGKSRPLIKIHRRKAGSGHDAADLESRVVQAIRRRLHQRTDIPSNQQDSQRKGSQIKPHFLIPDHLPRMPDQQQIIDIEIHPEQQHKYGTHVLQIRRIARHAVGMNAESAGTGGTERRAQAVKQRHAAKKQKEHAQDGHADIDAVKNFCGLPQPGGKLVHTRPGASARIRCAVRRSLLTPAPLPAQKPVCPYRPASA